ncbi:DNA polymerase III subunit delta' [Seongchinamella sediminis]|uniref:DNA-directed DNA polymerase n=1 Tax=Seongchinamella sediminis TaxID=2283635 RepID=A0A3L7E021_9GAMM|nr:DNA polymerase III subunit delta' [Seongchinamella sediminis]RLQ23118.1 DNA polymerase III subunit delta' [Seongchinamella sediminis]
MELTGLPVSSAPLPWQGDTWARFNRQLTEGNLPHALLLAGAANSGKRRLALALARLLLCQSPSGGLNCGSCHACELSASGSHGDLRWLQPEEKSRAIKIDQVRDTVSFATKTANFGAHKVVVIAPADAMNTNAANALLKSLEEPSPGTFLILVCDRLHGIPATIRSRCQIVKLPPPGAETALAWLDQATGSREQSATLLTLADGMPMLAEAMHCRADSEELVAARIACRSLVTGKIGSAEAARMLEQSSIDELLEQLATTLRSSLKQLDGPALNSARGRRIFATLDELNGIQKAVRGGANPNRQLLTEVLLEKLQSVLGSAAASGSIRPSTGETGA